MSVVRAAVIGCGDVSAVHFPAIAALDGVELVGVADADPGRAAAAGSRWGVPAFPDHHLLLSEISPDVVHICTPHDQHVPIALDCLAAGVSVLLEKPVAHTIDEAARLIEAARLAGAALPAFGTLANPAQANPAQANPAQATRTPAAPTSTAHASNSTTLAPATSASSGPGLAASTSAGPDPAALRPFVKVGVCLQNRYNLAVRGARERLLSGELGAVVGASATVLWHRDAGYFAARPWRGRRASSGGGVLINQAIHTIDLLYWLLGDVVDVRGHAGCYGFPEGVIDVEDTANLLLTHAGGARSVLFATTTNPVDAPVTVDIVTERARLHLSGDLTITHDDGRVETVAERRAPSGGRDYWGVSHELLIADFYRRLPDPEPFWISPAEGAVALRLIDQVYRMTERNA